MRALLAVLLLVLIAPPALAAPRPPRCYGAAARDPRHPCANPVLRFAARPSRLRTLLTPNEPCDPTATLGHRRADGRVTVCEFGTPRRRARRTFALIGDSHAMAWRGAVADLARRLRWHGVNLTRSHCPFNLARRALHPRDARGCLRFNRRVVRYLRGHRDITVAFVAHLSVGTPWTPAHGRSALDTQIHGYVRAWRALPHSIVRVFAIRDNPLIPDAGAPCIHAALRAHVEPGSTCAIPRSSALRPDAFFAVKHALPSHRYRVLDLTRFFCDDNVCFPVIGGLRVLKDTTHLTLAFSRTLGRYLRRATGIR